MTKNNSHTIPLAINTLAGALFFLHQRSDTGDRMVEFLAVSFRVHLLVIRETCCVKIYCNINIFSYVVRWPSG